MSAGELTAICGFLKPILIKASATQPDGLKIQNAYIYLTEIPVQAEEKEQSLSALTE
jgi:hypothetical protein